MFVINSNKSIYLTRGDSAIFTISAKQGKSNYVFKPNDIVRFKVFEKNKCDSIVLIKDITIAEETTSVQIYLSKNNTKIGELINKPKDYWYEIELNPDTIPQTIVGYDTDGPKIFRLFPEGDDN